MKIILLTVLILTGCVGMPKGVVMSDADRVSCAESGCTVWTDAQMKKLLRIAIQNGFAEGKKRRGELEL